MQSISYECLFYNKDDSVFTVCRYVWHMSHQQDSVYSKSNFACYSFPLCLSNIKLFHVQFLWELLGKEHYIYFQFFFINLLTCFPKLCKSKRACLFIRFFHFSIAHPCKDVSFCTHVTSLYSFSKASIFITTILNNSKSLKRSNDISFFSFSRMFRNYLSLPGVTKDNYLRYKLQ